jgi:NAD(P)-dependent dehydrogenase (short-subunit alcohol dehydrogenase family)
MTDVQRTSRQVAWIAGVGASAGLGAAVARRFAQGGLTVAVTGRTAERVEALAAEIRAAGGDAYAFAGDVANERDIAAIAARIAQLGPLGAAVFNAGNASRAPLLDLSVEQFEQVWRTGTLGGLVFGKEAVRALLLAGGGSLIFTGATASLRGRPPFAAFASSKAALRSLAQSFAREFGPKGVHVAHVVIDGGIDGEGLRQAAPHRVAERGDDGLLKPEAIADVYWHLHAQPRSAWTHELDLRPFTEAF